MVPAGSAFRLRTPQRGGIFLSFLLLLCFLLFFFVVYLVRHPLLRLAGGFWVVDEGPSASDAIVILGDDNYNGDRAARASEILRAGWAPRIIASGRYLRPYASIAELEEHDLTSRGIPVSAIVRFAHRAENTREETAAIGQLISSHGWKRIIVVTSNYHTRRSRYIAERTFPQGTILRVVAARDSEYDPDNWWRTRAGVKIFAHEFVGMIVALWELRHSDSQTSDSSSLDPLHPMVANSRHPRTLRVYS
ncbi:MAG: YdcF family protein [Acidobacteriia bacterium]|nr:YdcF family protein [Terriglobia bacterium]